MAPTDEKPPMNDSPREAEQGTLTQRAFRSAAWLSGTSVVRLGLKVISVAILARLLTPQDYGILGAAVVATQLAAMLYGLGLAPVLVQRKEIDRDHISTALGTSLTFSLVAGAALWFAAPSIAALMKIDALTWVVRWLALTTPLGAFRTVCEALLARDMRGREVALQPLVSFTVSAFLVAIPLAAAGFGYWSLVAMQGADVVIGALVLGIAAREWLVCPGFSVRAFRELWRMSLGFSLNQPLVYIGNNADKFLLARFLGAGVLGFYSRASFLSTNTARSFDYITRIAIFPAMAQVQDNEERLQRGLSKALSLVALTTLPASIFCIVFAKPIIDVLLGPQWSAASIPFALFSAMLYPTLGRKTCSAFFQALGRPYWLMGVESVNVAGIIVAVSLGAGYGLNVVCALLVIVKMTVFLTISGMACKVADLRWSSLLNLHRAPLALAMGTASLGIGTRYFLASMSSVVVIVAGLYAVAAFLLIIFRMKPQWTLGDWETNAVHDLRNVIYARLHRRLL